ncbi:MAG TPA: molybdopterin-dependent oxidoreductase [Gemmatimonadales bacterium]|nr:molybdopterin-dependent oxidoreductase [Gemmatimonadales bacterium]
MPHTRRQFLGAVGAAGAGIAWYQTQALRQAREPREDPGWQPGVESLLASSCLICPARCGIQGRTVDGRLVRIIGNPLHPMSRGGVCPRGIAGVQMLYHPERLSAPLIRAGTRGMGQWQPGTIDGAVGRIAERLRALRAEGRPEAAAVVAGYCEGSMADLWRQFLRAFGSPNYFSDAYGDGTETVMELMHGIAKRPGYDLERARLVVSFGAPLFEAWWSPLQAFVAFAGPGAAAAEPPRPRFVQVDTRFSHSAARAHEWIAVRPGTHGVLALGVAYVLIREELFDAGFVARHVAGFEDSRDAAGRPQEGYRSVVLHNYRTEEVSAVTGVPVERIVALAKTFAEQRPALAVCGTDVLLAPNGLLDGLAVHSLNVLMGNVNRPGGVLFGDHPPLESLAPPVLDAVARAGLAHDQLSGSAPAFGPGDAARRFAEAIAGGQAAPPEMLLLYYANPLASTPAVEAWRTALSRIPLVVSFSPFLDETTRYADLILPDLLPYERWQDAPTPDSFPYPVWGLVQPLVEPGDGRMHTGDVILKLGEVLGGSVAQSLPYPDFATLLQMRARGLFAARRGMTLGNEFERTHLRQMEERGWWLPEQAKFEDFWAGLVARGGWTDLFYDDTDPDRLSLNPGRRIDLMPARLARALESEHRGRTLYGLSAREASSSTGDFPLRLIPYRLSTLASGGLTLQRWIAEQPTVLSDRHWIPWVEVHPSTAGALGLDDGTMVWVESPHGRYRARLHLFPGAAPETVCAPYGLRHPDGEPANPLHLLDGSTDPLTGLSSWFTTAVRLAPATGTRS